MAAHRNDQSARLRIRVVLTATGAIAIALTLICAIINIWNYQLICQHADSMIDLIYKNEGVPSKPDRDEPVPLSSPLITAETPFETRYFSATIDSDGALTQLDAGHIAAVDDATMELMARNIAKSDKQRGFYGNYRFAAYATSSGEDSAIVVIVLDCTGDLEAFVGFRTISIAVCAACALIALVLLIPLSGRAVRPFAENLERQRRFVTDASHELKTPIAIIAANNDLLEELDGPSRWTESTRNQIQRLDYLVRDLIELARAEEPLDDATCSTVDLSLVVRSTCDEFSALAKTAGKSLSCTPSTPLLIWGVAPEIERLASILLDNAVKYCSDAGDVRVTLGVDNQIASRRARFTVSNPKGDLSSEDAAHLFDRFYRADTSRTRKTGGYGIGLALAQAIVLKHGGSIKADIADGRVVFTVLLPLR